MSNHEVVFLSSAPEMVPPSDLMAAPIDANELGFELDDQAKATITEFETAWKTFMKEHPKLVPEGKRERNIKLLQEELLKISKAKKVRRELQKQLDFFTKSSHTLETDFQKRINAVCTSQKEMQQDLHQKQDSIKMAGNFIEHSLVWRHFLDCLDKAARQARDDGSLFILQNISSKGGIGKKPKPTDRAIFLATDVGVSAEEVELKAYQIEIELVKAEVKMLQKEAEGLERILETQSFVARFLNDNNVWSMVSKPASLEARTALQ